MTRVPRAYFLAALVFVASTLAAASAYFLVKRSTRPAVSISFCLPVKKGWHLEQISRRSSLRVERVVNFSPHAQLTVTSWYSGWIPFFIWTFLSPPSGLPLTPGSGGSLRAGIGAPDRLAASLGVSWGGRIIGAGA